MRRRHQVHVRFTKDEWNQALAAAGAVGLNVPNLLRAALCRSVGELEPLPRKRRRARARDISRRRHEVDDRVERVEVNIKLDEREWRRLQIVAMRQDVNEASAVRTLVGTASQAQRSRQRAR
jgi:hypothetical protein